MIAQHDPASPVARASGVSRSEIKEEPKAGDIRAGRYPVSSALAPNASGPNPDFMHRDPSDNVVDD